MCTCLSQLRMSGVLLYSITAAYCHTFRHFVIETFILIKDELWVSPINFIFCTPYFYKIHFICNETCSFQKLRANVYFYHQSSTMLTSLVSTCGKLVKIIEVSYDPQVLHSNEVLLYIKIYSYMFGKWNSLYINQNLHRRNNITVRFQ